MAVDLPSLLARIAGRRVLVVGDIILDEYVDGEATRISPEAPVPVLRFAGQRSVLGGAANTAANVASLGGRATLVGLVGEDVAGRDIADLCARSGIRLVPVSDGRATTRKTRVISRQQQLLRIDHEDTRVIQPHAQAEFLATVDSLVEQADIIVMSDYAKGMLSAAAVDALRHAASAAGRLVVVDPRPSHAALYAGCHYLTPNWKEALGLLGQPDEEPSAEGVSRVGAAVRERFGANVLLTLGAQGMVLFPWDGSAVAVAAQAREVFDVSGAGDTVVASFALALAAGGSHAEALWLATRAAAVVVGKRGTATVSTAELLADATAAR